MHIPLSETSDIEILTFEQALISSNDDYDKDKWIYVPDFYSEYRYILGTRGEKPVICIGINPSTAAPEDLDNTLKSVERIALNNGFDSFIMFNVYAQRATKAHQMDKIYNESLHKENMLAFSYVLDMVKEPVIWAAWGTHINERDYLPLCVRDMIDTGNRYNAKWCSAGGLTKAGHPRHPLYLRKDTAFVPFDVSGYIDDLINQ